MLSTLKCSLKKLHSVTSCYETSSTDDRLLFSGSGEIYIIVLMHGPEEHGGTVGQAVPEEDRLYEP